MRERLRSFLGVWAPMLLGIAFIAGALNFLLAPRAAPADPNFPLDPAAAWACGGGLIVVGALLLLSTYGRWKKVRLARGPRRET